MTLVHAAFIAMRVHAINNHRWPWTILLIVLGTMSFPFNLVTAIKLKEISLTGGGPSLDGCWGVGSEPIRTPAWQRSAIAETVIGGYIMNTLVIAITWYRTAGLVLAARRANIRASFGYYLLRDGTTYFLASLIYNTVFIIVQETQNAQLGVVSITIQSIMMSRFILNLRTLDTSQTLPRISDNGSKMSEPRFRSSAFDNMGAQLDVEEVNDREYERMHLGVDEDDDEVGRLGTVHEPGVLGGYRAISKGDTAWDAED
ncbi:hypothetical protein C8Q80DRAFT_1189241 [Daedaleopsis nitida]|nr:hypothetical protein C8Q80DRAFT_1189241 [Daedaleopsis nitida]